MIFLKTDVNDMIFFFNSDNMTKYAIIFLIIDREAK
jgi:hypothetical protein